MPTYDYMCEACNATWEKEQRITEDPIKKCPKCGKRKAKRLISGGSFVLKGSGWFSDLYHKPGSGGSSSDGKSGASSPKSGGGGKSSKGE